MRYPYCTSTLNIYVELLIIDECPLSRITVQMNGSSFFQSAFIDCELLTFVLHVLVAVDKKIRFRKVNQMENMNRMNKLYNSEHTWKLGFYITFLFVALIVEQASYIYRKTDSSNVSVRHLFLSYFKIFKN